MIEPDKAWDRVTVVGGGLAGCEAAFQLAERNIPVLLLEAKPKARSPAHKMDHLAELVCSNSLKSLDPASPAGLLKAELTELGSVFMMCAQKCRVPAGTALAVDRERLARLVTQRIENHSMIRVERTSVDQLPGGPAIIATGPLTIGKLPDALAEAAGQPLYFYDAIAPIVSADSIDWDRAFVASRWGRSGSETQKSEGDYVNCPLDREAYETLVGELLSGGKVTPHPFEEPRYFEACLPVEVMASRGLDVLRHGPMRPVGLREPATGKRPYAVVQLRAEDTERTAYNLVGFQTRLTYPEQKRILRLIPALSKAEFLRFGSIHRNTYLPAPSCLGPRLQLARCPDVRIAGLLSGVEGYVESVAMGLLCGVMLAADLNRVDLPPPPPTTAIGSLYHYLTRERAAGENFTPTNMNLSLLPPLELPPGTRKVSKKQRKALISERGLSYMQEWIADHPDVWPKTTGQ